MGRKSLSKSFKNDAENRIFYAQGRDHQFFETIEPKKVLSHEEQYDLFVQLKAARDSGDEERVQKLRETIAEGNLRLVVNIVGNGAFRENKDLKFQDFAMAGYYGLMQAIDRYDPHAKNGAKFPSFALWWIRSAALAEIYDHSETIRRPWRSNPANEVKNYIRQYKNAYMQRHNTIDAPDPSAEEILEAFPKLKKEASRVKLYFAGAAGTTSIDQPFNVDTTSSLLDVYEDKTFEDPSWSAEKAQFGELITQAIQEQLDEKQQNILRVLYDLDEVYGDLHENEVSRLLEVPKQKWSKIEQEALEILKANVQPH